MRKAKVKMHQTTAGYLVQDEEGFLFIYTEAYLEWADSEPVSLTLPVQKAPHTSKVMFAFFDGLIPEGWLLTIV